jgi:hypothetical protein
MCYPVQISIEIIDLCEPVTNIPYFEKNILYNIFCRFAGGGYFISIGVNATLVSVEQLPEGFFVAFGHLPQQGQFVMWYW